MSKFMHHVKNFLIDSRGTALVEFAITAPVFVLGVIGTLQVAIMLLIQNALDESVYEAARYGVTGYAGSSGSRSAAIQQIIYTKASAYSMKLIDTPQLAITTNVYGSLANVGNTTPSSASYGGSGQVVQYQVSYVWKSLYIPFNSSSTITLNSKIIVSNEPF